MSQHAQRLTFYAPFSQHLRQRNTLKHTREYLIIKIQTSAHKREGYSLQPVSQNALWRSPFTNKRYLHPPFAENIVTMWPECRVILGDVVEKTCGYISSGFRILTGENLESPDFTRVQYEVRGDGAPIHALSQNMGTYALRMESFCDIRRVPACYTQFTLTNPTDRAVTDLIALLPRTGREDHLVGTEVDGYAQYDSNVHNWGFLPSDWRMENDLLTDGQYEIRLQLPGCMDAEWQGDVKGLVWYQRHLLKIRFTLAPHESIRFACMFRHGQTCSFDYEGEKEKALSFWQGELKRLKVRPGREEHQEMVNNLVLQCLQMFAYPVGKNYVLPRQGGLQRVIWPNEGIEFLVALDRLGDFGDYTETAYETYFFTLQQKEGEDAGAVQNLSGNKWGSITGAACIGCARHTLFMDKQEVFDKFKDEMYLAFRWMERQRAKTMDGSCRGVGIFPPMKSSDWPGEFQSWTFTDAFNLIGYEWLSKAFSRFRDPRAEEVKKGYDSYMVAMKKILSDLADKSIFGDEMRLTFDLGVEMTDPPYGSYATDGPGMLIRAKVIDPGSREAKLIENYYRNRGMMKNGLTGMMNDGLIFQGHNADPWAGHTWYTSFSDLYWFYNWLESGERDKAAETLEAQFQYGMSKEYYLLERYADNDPYWTPWMPNASANGRLLMMLTDFYKETE